MRLRRYYRQKGRWVFEAAPLLDAAALRHSRLRRAWPRARAIDAEITKALTWTRQRDVWVHWVYTNAALQGRQEFVQTIRNSTGMPDKCLVIFYPTCNPDGIPVVLVPTRHPTELHCWELRCPLPSQVQRCVGPVQITLEYRWRGGGLLTSDEFAALPEPREALRKDGYEFALGRVPDSGGQLAALELIVELPFEYTPAAEPIVCVNGDTSQPVPELQQQLRVLAPGTFVLRVPYPQPGCHYQIAWRPPTRAEVLQEVKGGQAEATFREAARQRGPRLLQAFEAVMRRAALGPPSSLALYLQPGDELKLERVALQVPEETGTAQPPAEVPLTDHLAGVVRAWWGETGIGAAGRPNARAMGLLDGEALLICLPLRFSFQPIAPPAWGVLRVALSGTQIADATRLTSPMNSDRIFQVLSTAAAALLSEAFTPTEDRPR